MRCPDGWLLSEMLRDTEKDTPEREEILAALRSHMSGCPDCHAAVEQGEREEQK